jgi:archaellum biogenesis ATPase FlaH
MKSDKVDFSILDMNIYKDFVVFNISSCSGKEYTLCVDKNGNGYCTCPSFYFRKKCKHFEKIKKVGKMVLSWDNVEESKVVREFKSSLNVINDMFGGSAYTSDNIFGLFGLAGEGKSLLCIQEAFYLMSQGYRVLYIDTEGSLVSQLRKCWADVFMARFNLSKNDLNERFFIQNFREKEFADKEEKIEKVLYYFGDNTEIEKKGNKIELKWIEKKGRKPKDNRSLIEKDVDKYNIDFIILDSITNPIRIAISSSPQNYPAKSDIEARILGHLLELQVEYNVGMLVTLQASYNPTNPYDNEVSMRGGLSAAYNIKRRISLIRRNKNGLENYRIFFFERGETGSSKSTVGFAKIDDFGYADLDLEKEGLTISDLLTGSQLKKVYGEEDTE